MSYYGKIRQFINKIKESRPKWARLAFFSAAPKDPLLYFGGVSLILFLISFFSFGSLPNFIFSKAEVSSYFNPFLSSSARFGSESPEFVLVANSSLKAVLPPGSITPQILGALIEGFEPEDTKKIITEYLVEQGDTLSLIAAKFDISLNTVLWANSLSSNSKISPGQKLIIPPVSGILHHVQSGDTVSGVGQRYQTKLEEIIAFNNLASADDIFIGDVLIVPGGIMPKIKISVPQIPLALSYFICPISSPCRITQGLHWNNAIDFSNGKCGDPIFAAAGGQVLKVKLTNSTSQWAFGGAGNTVSVLHPNGVVTSYGHLLSSFVKQGDQVSQGQIIALMGGQPNTPGAGKTTGCHVHFGVSGSKNPFSR